MCLRRSIEIAWRVGGVDVYDAGLGDLHVQTIWRRWWQYQFHGSLPIQSIIMSFFLLRALVCSTRCFRYEWMKEVCACAGVWRVLAMHIHSPPSRCWCSFLLDYLFIYLLFSISMCGECVCVCAVCSNRCNLCRKCFFPFIHIDVHCILNVSRWCGASYTRSETNLVWKHELRHGIHVRWALGNAKDNRWPQDKRNH